MFLIEYEKGGFVDGETINWVKVSSSGVTCTQTGDSETLITVDKDYRSTFVNNLQVLNENGSIEKAYQDAVNSNI